MMLDSLPMSALIAISIIIGVPAAFYVLRGLGGFWQYQYWPALGYYGAGCLALFCLAAVWLMGPWRV